jgi:CelD/BcsL family acetyltransferase involved in cellulose biosynthesis
MHIAAEVENSLLVHRLPCLEALTGLETEWQSLEEQNFPRTPFSSTLWLALWWQHLRRRNLVFRDEFFGHVIRDAGGRLVAIAPLMKTHCPGLSPAGMRIVQFFGCDPNLTELRGVICRPEDHDRAIGALVEHFRRHRSEWDVFRWCGLRQSAEWFNALPRGFQFFARRDICDYIVDLPHSWEILKAQVSSNTRKSLRKAYEFLERDGHSFVLRVVERPEDVPSALDRFLSLHAARSDAANMIDHPNKFATESARAFLTSYLDKSAQRGQLRLFELEIGSKVVASRLAFQIDADLYLYYAGYDPTWKNYSVMTTLVCEIVKWSIAQGLDRVNLSTGNDQSKLRWKPRELVFSEAVQRSDTWRGHASFYGFLVYEALSRARERLKV